MPICKIIKSYDNSAHWALNDVVDITDPWTLIKEGKVVLLNEKGEEIAPPGMEFKCPICMKIEVGAMDLANHILTHAGKAELPKKTDDEVRQRRLDVLEKARAARKLKQLQKNVKEKEKEAREALKAALESVNPVQQEVK